ncbi:hypothetical protein SCE1572_06280 [Sorangium cellulosum So0157-2]|uniref:Bulb-type lectin domain-containing protein n=1 Tax=Sorangium cellulosum So0157-2 TaxID=1254432 RepID=S4XU65_SORCE|nr:hypothetical protein SCE1572_06280 [Sorangium cellulosum So0157-2]
MPGSIVACYSGPEGTIGVGRCTAGTQVCRPDGFGYGPCTGEITPAAEVCASPQDESCDGDPHCPRPAAWARGFGIEATYIRSSIAVDAMGNHYILGSFEGTVDLGTGPLTSAGDSDVFLLKLDPSGAPLWSKRFGTPLRETGDALAIDGNGNVLIVGSYEADRYNHFINSRDLGFGGCAFLANGGFDNAAMYMAKFDPDGNHIWSGGFSSDVHYGPTVTQMALDALNNAYIAFAVEERTEMVKVDAMGNVVWTRRGPDAHSYRKLALDGAGNVVTTGTGWDHINYTSFLVVSKFSPGGDLLWSRPMYDYLSAGNVAVNSAGEIFVLVDNVLIKLDQEGEEVFSHPVHRSGSIAVDPADNIFLGGGGLTMLDPSGTERWTLDFAASVGDIAFSPNGAVAVTGVVSGPVDFGTGPIAYTEGRDIYVAAFNPPASGDSGEGGGGGSDGGGGGGAPSETCVPGSVIACYSGPAGTRGVGPCAAGTQTCRPNGLGFGDCVGEVTPAEDICSTPEDEDCDGDPHCPMLSWARGFGSTGADEGLNIASDDAGNYYVAGTFTGTVDFGAGPLTGPSPRGGHFLLKLDPSGAPLWSERLPSDRPLVMAVDGNGDLLLAGTYSPDGARVLNQCLPPFPAYNTAAFVAKLDRDGNIIWSRAPIVPPKPPDRPLEIYSFPERIAVDALGNTYLAFVNIWTDGAYLLKLSPGGDVLWNHQITPPPAEYDHPLYNADLAIDSAGNALTVTAPESAAGYLTVSKFDPTGAVLWSRPFAPDPSIPPGGAGKAAWSVAVNAADEVFVAGVTDGTVDLGGGVLPAGPVLLKLDAAGAYVFSDSIPFGDTLALDAAGNIVVAGSGLAKLDPSGAELWTLGFDASARGITISPAGTIALTGAASAAVDFGTGPIPHAGGSDIFVATFNP